MCIYVYIYVAYAGLRMSADRDSPDDVHSAVENENTVSAYSISKQILPFGFAELYCCRCSRHRASSMQVSRRYLAE